MNPLPNKGFNAVIEAIDTIIKSEGLKSGDKLPSERYLSESLNISRSSVREALRALEMLGVIETRRGEGTYLSEMDNNQFIEIIAGYLITSKTQSSEIKDFIHIIEQFVRNDQNMTQDELSIEIEKRNTIMFRVWKLLNRYEQIYDQQE